MLRFCLDAYIRKKFLVSMAVLLCLKNPFGLDKHIKYQRYFKGIDLK